jgi:hypothetical protein
MLEFKILYCNPIEEFGTFTLFQALILAHFLIVHVRKRQVFRFVSYCLGLKRKPLFHFREKRK